MAVVSAEAILELYQSGFTVAAICQRLQCRKGRVEAEIRRHEARVAEGAESDPRPRRSTVWPRYTIEDLVSSALGGGSSYYERGGTQKPYAPKAPHHRMPNGKRDPDYSLSREEWLAGLDLDVLSRPDGAVN